MPVLYSADPEEPQPILSVLETNAALFTANEGAVIWRKSPFRAASTESISSFNALSEDTVTLQHHAPRLMPLLTPKDPVDTPLSPPQLHSYYSPNSWLHVYRQLCNGAVASSDQVILTHKKHAELNTKTAVRAACCVRVLPSLDLIKTALRKLIKKRRGERYEISESVSAIGGVIRPGTTVGRRGSRHDEATMLYMPLPHIWAARSKQQCQEINVYDAISGACLLRIANPKTDVSPTSLLHAPFRGFMNRELKVLPITQPQDLLRLKSSQLIETDYVWVGFSDGSIRLFPANPNRVRDTDRSEQMQKGELADLVFELPKFHNASIIVIARSPCHHDDEGTDLSTTTRLSTAIRYMTAAGAADSESNREHLSLMCTASVDSSIVVWDVRKIYQTMEAMRALKREAVLGAVGGRGAASATSRMSTVYLGTSAGTAAAVSCLDASACGDVVTIDGFMEGKSAFSVRSTCTMIKVRPVLRLRGGVAGLKSMRWVSTLVTTEGYQKGRDIAKMTRHPEEQSAPKLLKERRAVQTITRFGRREEHRRMLELSEEEMQEVEAELKELLPPLAEEPVQSLRVNLIIAGDCVGSVHIWSLDDELNRHPITGSLDLNAAQEVHSPHHTSPRHSMSRVSTDGAKDTRRASESPGGTSLGSGKAPYSVASASIRMSATHCTARMGTGVKSVGAASTQRKTQAKTTPKKRTGTVQSKTVTGTSDALAIRSKTPTAKKNAGVSLSVVTTPARMDGSKVHQPSRGRQVRGLSATPATATGCASGNRPKMPDMEPQLSRPSKLQKLAIVRRDANTPVRELNNVMSSGKSCFSEDDPAAGTQAASSSRRRTPVKTSLSQPRISAKQSKILNANGATSKATITRPQHCDGTPLRTLTGISASLAPARAVSLVGAPRSHSRNATPHRVAVEDQGAQRFGRRGASSSHATRNEFLSRTSRCRIEFTGGVAITGMAVDTPITLRTTLRRLPGSEGRPFSLLEKMTPEEVERRALENSFETLTSEKALFLVFQKLQLYVAVEGVVLSLRCIPNWQLPDGDGRNLFQQRQAEMTDGTLTSTMAESPGSDEVAVEGQVELSSFNIQFRKTILEAHSQPVTHLSFDSARGLLWVARNDGLLSLFSKDTRKIVTRVAHPCADSALAPPALAEWQKEQRAYLREFTASHSSPSLVWHEATRGYEPAHFDAILPFSKRTQSAVVMVWNAAQPRRRFASSDLQHHPVQREASACGDSVVLNANYRVRRDSHASLPHMPLTCLRAQLIEGRSDLSSSARRREKSLRHFLDRLLSCRFNADTVRRAQRDNYEFHSERIKEKVQHTLAALRAHVLCPTRRRYYDLWTRYTRFFSNGHLVRHRRTARARWSGAVASAMARITALTHRSRYFGYWYRAHIFYVMKRQGGRLEDMATCSNRSIHYFPTVRMMEWVWQHHTRTRVLWHWRSLVEGRRFGFPPGGSLFASPTASPGVPCLSSTPSGATHSVHAVFSPSQQSLYFHAPLTRSHTKTFQPASRSPLLSVLHTPYQEKDHVCVPTWGVREESLHREWNLEAMVGGTCNGARFRCRDASTDKTPSVTGGDTASLLTSYPTLLSGFLEMLALLYNTRSSVMRFSVSPHWPRSVWDESWLSILESAEGAADTDDSDGRRLAVFSYGLLPLLQGLLSTSEDVLPNLHDASVAEEVMSMMKGIQLCMDYITADPEAFFSDSAHFPKVGLCAEATGSAVTTADTVGGGAVFCDITGGRNGQEDAMHLHMVAPITVFIKIMHFFAVKAMNDNESLAAMKELMEEKESLEVFISFAEDEDKFERQR